MWHNTSGGGAAINGSKKGFTLAEILIVLAIIGTIASLVIGAAINNVNEKATVVKVLRAYSDLNRIFDLYKVTKNNISIIDEMAETNRKINYRDFGPAHAQLRAFFNSNLNIIKNCERNKGCFPDKCHTINRVPIADGSDTILPCSQEWNPYTNSGAYYKYILKGGYSLALQMPWDIHNIESLIAIDTNGTKKPNAYGRDIFIFKLNKDGVSPLKNEDCNSKGPGKGCSNYIIKNRNMKYLK